MPMVGKKKFPYTEKGKKSAETYASAKGMKMHEKKESKKEQKHKRRKKGRGGNCLGWGFLVAREDSARSSYTLIDSHPAGRSGPMRDPLSARPGRSGPLPRRVPGSPPS